MRKNRSWSKSQKLAIIAESKQIGVLAASRKHNVAASQIHGWRTKVELNGEASLDGYQAQESSEMRSLRQDIAALKEIVAEQQLALRIKDALLKKTELRLKSDS